MDDRASTLAACESRVRICRKCGLAETRTTTVFGEGNPAAELMFIGEGPCRREDLTGRPFVGRAGELLTRIIENGMGVPRSSVYIANLVKCRPTVDMKKERDRPPDPSEIEACTPYLDEQITIVKPRVIVALGSPAAKFLLKTSRGISQIRGTWGEYRGIPVMPTYHPSFLLRQAGDQAVVKRQVWEDMKQVLQKLGWPIPAVRKGE